MLCTCGHSSGVLFQKSQWALASPLFAALAAPISG